MRISTQMHHETALSISVPVRTSLKLTLMNGDDIVVERVEGDLEVNNMNGDISLTNVAGTGIIHSANGEVKAHFSRVTGKPMSFTTLNGDVDVALPADIKATVRLDSGHGDIYTDFPIEMLPTTMQSDGGGQPQQGREISHQDGEGDGRQDQRRRRRIHAEDAERRHPSPPLSGGRGGGKNSRTASSWSRRVEAGRWHNAAIMPSLQRLLLVAGALAASGSLLTASIPLPHTNSRP